MFLAWYYSHETRIRWYLNGKAGVKKVPRKWTSKYKSKKIFVCIKIAEMKNF